MAGQGCPVCAALGTGDNGLWVGVSAGEVADVHPERRGRLPGYWIVVWRRGHVAEPGDLDRLQAGRYRAEVLAAGRAVRARCRPAQLNSMTPGNTVSQLRAHVLPRYRDDPAAGGPIAREAIVAADPVPEAGLHRQAADLRGLPGT
jgi:diadenosine tetraphosphate (Ap4A) HIT family hydrolase